MKRTACRVRIRGVEQFSPSACAVLLAALVGLALVAGWFSLDALRWAFPYLIAFLASL